MKRTQSATPLDAVQVERRGLIKDVWLRTDIEEIEVEIEEGLSQTMWEAFEAYGTVPASVTAEEIEDDFDDWWARFEDEAMTDAERIAQVKNATNTQGDAIADLAWLASDTDESMSMIADAIAELSADVSTLFEIISGGE